MQCMCFCVPVWLQAFESSLSPFFLKYMAFQSHIKYHFKDSKIRCFVELLTFCFSIP